MEKVTSKNTNRALRDTNAVKTTVLLSHFRNNYGFISPTHSSYLQYNLKLWAGAVRFDPGRNLAEGSPLANTQKIVKK